MADIPRLIEHAFLLKQTSLNSVHEKKVLHGHSSTRHIWPARWKLAVCRAKKGDIEVSANDQVKVYNMRWGYWLFAVYEYATPIPRLIRVQDPFDNLLARARGIVLFGIKPILSLAEE